MNKFRWRRILIPIACLAAAFGCASLSSRFLETANAGLSKAFNLLKIILVIFGVSYGCRRK